MATARFHVSIVKPLLKNAITNIQKAIDIERAKKEKKKSRWHWFALGTPYLSRGFTPTRNKFKSVLRLCDAHTISYVTLTHKEYSEIKHWAKR